MRVHIVGAVGSVALAVAVSGASPARAEHVVLEFQGEVNALLDNPGESGVTWGDPISGIVSYETDWQAYASYAYSGSPLAVYLFEPMSATGTSLSVTFGGRTLETKPDGSMRITIQDDQPLADYRFMDAFQGTAPGRLASGLDPDGFFANAQRVVLGFHFTNTSYFSPVAPFNNTLVIPADVSAFETQLATVEIDGDGDGTTRDDLIAITFKITSIRVPPIIEPGAQVDDSATLGSGVVIGSGAQVAKGATLGDGVSVGANADVRKDAVVGDGTTIGEGAVVKKDATLGSGVTLGAGSILGAEAAVGDGTTVGANVEIGNRTQIGDDVLIGDGTVIGPDVIIGDRVQIGSGCTIGHGAVIGDDAHIGDGITIAANAVVPPGTTLP